MSNFCIIDVLPSVQLFVNSQTALSAARLRTAGQGLFLEFELPTVNSRP